MTGFNFTAKNTMLSELVGLVTHVSVHTVPDPGEEGLGEVDSPVYQRQEVLWGSVANGEVSMVGELNFIIPAGTTVRSIGLWSSDSGGVFYGFQPIDEEVYPMEGPLTITALRLDLNG